MNKSNYDIKSILLKVSQTIESSTDPINFDLEKFFLNEGCNEQLADILSDYFPAACGRAFLKELGVSNSEFYQRKDINGTLGPALRYDSDPLWNEVEIFAEFLRTESNTRKQFSLIAQHSAEIDTVNQALNNGKSLTDLKGAKMGNVVFNATLNPLT